MTAKSSTDLKSEINTNIADNTAGDISAADIRTSLTNIVDSIKTVVEESTLTLSALTLTGNNSLQMTGDGTTWDDFMVPATQHKVGTNNKPTWNETDLGYDFPQNDATAIVYMNVQLPHWWKEGSTIFPHVHWRQTQNLNATFKMDYRWMDIGGAIPGSWTTYTMSTPVITYSTGTIHQLSTNATGISGSGKTFSSILQIKLYRDDNVYTGNAMVLSFDIHLEKSRLGTGTELS